MISVSHIVKGIRRLRIVTSMVALLILPSLCGCRGGGDDTAIPRPKAYPRLAVVGDTYVAVENAPAGFEINADAVVRDFDTRPNPGRGGLRSRATQWITVEYPQYGARIYYTFTPVDDDDRESVTENRMERIGLNFSGMPRKTTEISSQDGSLRGYLMTTRERCAFPVQFIMEGERMVVSGSLFMPSMTVNPDSVAPATELMTRDILHGLRGLHDTTD